MKKDKISAGWLRKASWIFILLAFVLGAGIVPAPAYADPFTNGGQPIGGGIPVTDTGRISVLIKKLAMKIANWAEELGLLGKVIKWIKKAWDAFEEWMDKLNITRKKTAAVKVAGSQAIVKTMEETTNYRIDAGVQNQFLRESMEVAAEDVPAQNEHVCKAILAHQSSATVEDFEEKMSCFALSAIESMYRGSKDDGSGPQYAADDRKMRCALKLGNKIDGFPDSCVDDTTKGDDGRKLADFDLKSFDGGQVLEVAKIKSQSIDGVTYNIPDPQNTEQKFWAAGLYYCMKMAGPRPTPPTKDQIKTPEGMVRRAQWNHCAAAQSALAKACTNFLAYYTRPNDDSGDLIRQQNTRCLAGSQTANVTLPKSFRECNAGMSPYQSYYLAHVMCKSSQQYISASMGKATHADLMATVDKCTSAWNAWKTLEAERKDSLVKAILAASYLSSCWRGAGR